MGFWIVLGVSLLFSAGSFVLSELLRPKPKLQNAKPEQVTFPTNSETRRIPVVWGRVRIAPNIMWYGNQTQSRITVRVSTGLLTGGKRQTIGFRYSVGVQYGLCRGQVDAIKRIWVGDDVLWSGSSTHEQAIVINSPAFLGGDDFGNGGIVGTFRFHDGRIGQALNTYIAAFQDPPNSPNYGGTSYLAAEAVYFGNSASLRPPAIELERFPNNVGLGGGRHIIGGTEVNPVEVLYEILTDGDWGYGYSVLDVDVQNFIDVGDVLHAEGNGWAFSWEAETDLGEIMDLVEEQIDGVVFLNRETGQWQIKLVRADYVLANLLAVTPDTNQLEVEDFTGATWHGTANQTRIAFKDRARDYFDTFAGAFDTANLAMQGGEIVIANLTFPGVKSATNASALAAREMAARGYPLAHAVLRLNRSAWVLNPGDVFRWTEPRFRFVDVPMRVTSINYGNFRQGSIRVTCVQDIFGLDSAFFGEPQAPQWIRPTEDVGAISAANSRVFEAPKAFIDRDETQPIRPCRYWFGARRQSGPEIAIQAWQRNAAGAPSGAFSLDGEVVGTFTVGRLVAGLSAGAAQPTPAVVVEGVPDSVLEIAEAFETVTATAIGQNLRNLILINGEFLGVTAVSMVGASTIQLDGAYRGLLDTVPADHAMNDLVYFVFVWGTLNQTEIPPTNQVEVQLRARSRTDTTTEGESVTQSFTMANRYNRPYPPQELRVNGARYPASASVDVQRPTTSGLDNLGLDVTYNRKDFRTTDEVTAAMGETTLPADFPAANTTQYRSILTEDPAGTPSILITTAWADTRNPFFSRTAILRATVGVLPDDLRVQVETRHTVASVVYEATQDLVWDFAVGASALDNDQNWGNLAQNVASATYAAPDTGSYGLEIGAALPAAGVVEFRINGGTWTTGIAASATTGSVPGVTAADTIEVRHTSGGAVETFLQLTPPTSTAGAYAILI